MRPPRLVSGLGCGQVTSFGMCPPSPSEMTVKLDSDERQKRGNAPQRARAFWGSQQRGGSRSGFGRSGGRCGEAALGSTPGRQGDSAAWTDRRKAGQRGPRGPTRPSSRPPSEVGRNGALPKVTWNAGKQKGRGAPNRARPGLVLGRWGPRLLCKDTYTDGPEQDERLRGPEVQAPGKAVTHLSGSTTFCDGSQSFDT